MTHIEEAQCAGFPTYQIGPVDGARILPRSQRCGMSGLGAMRYVPSGSYEGAIGGIYSTRQVSMRGLGAFRGGYNLEVRPARPATGAMLRGLRGLHGSTADRVGTTCNILGTAAGVVSSIGMQANTTDPNAQYTVQGFMDEQSRYQTYQTVGQVAAGANTICQAIVQSSGETTQQEPQVSAGVVPWSIPKSTSPGTVAPAPSDSEGLVMKVGVGLGAALLAGGIGFLLLR